MEDCQNKGHVFESATSPVRRYLTYFPQPRSLVNQHKLREFCRLNGILLTSYAALGARGTIWGSNRVVECKMLNDIASARGKTVAQVFLRWAYEQGVSLLAKSFNKERMKENLVIFHWELTDISLNPEDVSVKIIFLIMARLGPLKSSGMGNFNKVRHPWLRCAVLSHLNNSPTLSINNINNNNNTAI